MSSVKLEDIELQNIIAYEKQYFTVTQQYGVYHHQLDKLNAELESIKTELNNLELRREAIVKDLLDKYGNGRVDLETGHFVSE